MGGGMEEREVKEKMSSQQSMRIVSERGVPLISTCSRMFCELGEKNGQLFFDSRVRVAVKPMDCRGGIV